MLNLELDEFVMALKDGSLKNVGPANKAATVKLFNATSTEVREFGDRRIKIAAADDEGNEVEIALSPEQASAIATRIDTLEAESPVFE